MKSLLITLFLFTFLNSCSALKDLASVQKPTLSVTDVNVSGLSLQDIELTFDIEVENPNPVSIDLNSYEYDFMIENNSFVKGNQPLATTINSTSKSVVQIPVNFTFKELFQTFDSISDKDETGFQLNANIAVDLPILGLTEIPVNRSGTFPVVKVPTISASKLSVKDLSFTKAELELELNINNPNAFSIDLNDLDYEIDINGLRSISGSTGKSIEISEKGSSTLKIPVTFNLIELGRSAYQLLSSDKELEYSLTGNTNIDTSLPFFKPSNYNFDRSGSLNLFN
jgi:LEA14-like dessication related protein